MVLMAMRRKGTGVGCPNLVPPSGGKGDRARGTPSPDLRTRSAAQELALASGHAVNEASRLTPRINMDYTYRDGL